MFCPINLGQSSQDSKNLSKSKKSKAYVPNRFQTSSRSIWGNQVKIPRISQRCQKQSGAYIQVDLKLFFNQHGALSWGNDYEGHDAHSAHLIKSSRGESFQSTY